MRRFNTWLNGFSLYYGVVVFNTARSLAHTLAAGITFTLLAIVYLFFITPYSFVYRLFHQSKVLEFFGEHKTDSYYRPYQQSSFDVSFFERPW